MFVVEESNGPKPFDGNVDGFFHNRRCARRRTVLADRWVHQSRQHRVVSGDNATCVNLSEVDGLWLRTMFYRIDITRRALCIVPATAYGGQVVQFVPGL